LGAWPCSRRATLVTRHVGAAHPRTSAHPGSDGLSQAMPRRGGSSRKSRHGGAAPGAAGLGWAVIAGPRKLGHVARSAQSGTPHRPGTRWPRRLRRRRAAYPSHRHSPGPAGTSGPVSRHPDRRRCAWRCAWRCSRHRASTGTHPTQATSVTSAPTSMADRRRARRGSTRKVTAPEVCLVTSSPLQPVEMNCLSSLDVPGLRHTCPITSLMGMLLGDISSDLPLNRENAL